MSEHGTGFPAGRRQDTEGYLLVKGTAGLGNRILALLTAIIYARITNRRLLVDWSDQTYSADGSNTFFRLFSSTFCGDPEELPETESVAPQIWNDRLDMSIFDLARSIPPYGLPSLRLRATTSIDTARRDYGQEVLVFWSFTQHVNHLRTDFRGSFGHLGDMDDESVLGWTFENHLVPLSEIRGRVDSFLSRYFSGPVLGVHLRYTDKKGRLEKILHRADREIRKNKELGIYLASDNARIRDLFIKRYPRVFCSEAWLSPSSLPIHRNPGRPDLVSVAADALVDLYVLAACDRLLLDSVSSFAYLAVLLSRSRRVPVTDVHPLHWLSKSSRSRLHRFGVLHMINPLKYLLRRLGR